MIFMAIYDNDHQLSSIIINYHQLSNIYPTYIQHIQRTRSWCLHPNAPCAPEARRPPQVSAEQCALGDADAKDREKDDEMMSGARRVGNDGLVVSNCTTMVSKLP